MPVNGPSGGLCYPCRTLPRSRGRRPPGHQDGRFWMGSAGSRVREEYLSWSTPYLGGRVFEMLAFGHAGVPVVLFPTSQARYYEYKDFRLIEAAAPLVGAGRGKLYCPDGIDAESWYNHGIHPADRVKTHMAYENVIVQQVFEHA